MDLWKMRKYIIQDFSQFFSSKIISLQVGEQLRKACEKYCVEEFESLLPKCYEYATNFTTEIPNYVHNQIPGFVHENIANQLNETFICYQLAACP